MSVASTTNVTSDQKSSAIFSPISELISKSWDMVKVSWKNLLILGIILWVPVIAIVMMMALGLGGSFAVMGSMAEISPAAIGTMIVVGALALVAMMVFSSVIGTSMMISVAEAQQKPSVGSLISRGLKLFLPVFFTSLLMFFIIYGGLFLLIIPGIIIAILTGFSIYEVVFTEHRYVAAIKNSVKMVAQNFGELFVRVLVIIGISIGLVIVESILQNMAGGESSEAMPLISLVMGVVQMIFGWFIMCYYFLLYTEARKATDFNKSASITWMWVVAVLGWLLSVVVLFYASTALTSLLNEYNNNGSTQNFGEFNPAIVDETGEVNTDLLLQEYGQDMSEEEKEMFRKMMQNAESALEQDQEAMEREQQSL